MPTFQQKPLFNSRFEKYGIHPKCRKCPRLKECPHPQYNAEGVYRFSCRDLEGEINVG